MINREKKEINTVHERDLDNLLQRLGIKDKFDANKFKCKFCKDIITNDNIYSVLPESGGINFICNKPPCVIEMTEYLTEKNRNKRG